MGVITRSKSNQMDNDERQRFLAGLATNEGQTGDESSRRGDAREIPMENRELTTDEGHGGAEGAARPPSAQGAARGEDTPAPVEMPSAQHIHAEVIVHEHPTALPSVDTLLDRHLKKNTGAIRKEKVPAQPTVPHSKASFIISSTSTRRKQKAELQMIEELERLEEERYRKKKELIQKKLKLLEQLEDEGSLSSSSATSRAGTPPPEPATSEHRVGEWLNSLKRQQQPEEIEETPQLPREEEQVRAESHAAPPRIVRAPSPSRGPRERAPSLAEERKAPLPNLLPPPKAVRAPTQPRGPRNREREEAVPLWFPRTLSPPLRPRASVVRVTSPERPKMLFQSTPMTATYRSRSREIDDSQPLSDAATAFNKLTDTLKYFAKPPPKQVYDLPCFYGDPNEWMLFYNAYKETTHRYEFSTYENMARLRNCLKGEARQCVQHLLSTANQPDLIIRLLKKNFGRTDLLNDKALDELKKLPHLGPSALDLNSFAIKVINIVSTLIDLDAKNYADNPLLIREITDQLSPHLRSRWCTYAKEHVRKDGNSELTLLAWFLMEESDAELEFSHSKAPAKRSTTTTSRETPRRDHENKQRATARPSQSKHERTFATQNISSDACLCCDGDHRTTECKKILNMDVPARWDWAKENHVCYQCLNRKHRRDVCKARKCNIFGCSRGHHRLLHLKKEETQASRETSSHPAPVQHDSRKEEKEQEDGKCERVNFAFNTQAAEQVNSTLLKVIPIIVEGPLKRVKTYAFLDDGSTVSLAEEDLMKEIGATGPEVPLSLNGVSRMKTGDKQSQKMIIKVRGHDNGPAYDLTVRTVRELGLRGDSINSKILKLEHLADLPEACYDKGVPRILIGGDHWHLMIPHEVRVGRLDQPAAVLTLLGWAIFGKAPRTVKRGTEEDVSFHCREDEELHGMLQEYFNIDSLGIKNMSKQHPTDQRAMELFEKTVKKIEGPRYEVGQLWKTDDIKIPPSVDNAISRLQSIEKKMARDPEFAANYKAQIQNLLEKKYAERIERMPDSNITYVLPHFAMTNVNKPGKLRLVFDAACKIKGKSLNDYLLERPDLLQSLIGILFRFREGKYAVVADLAEMFLQIKIRPEDQASQLFLWRDNPKEKPQLFKMTSVIFGAASSPFLAHSVRNKNVLDNAKRYPAAVEEITRNHYMDDFVSSFKNEEELIRSANQVAACHREGGFQLRGWCSNSKRLLKEIPEQQRANLPAQLGNKENKILGMYWDPENDVLGFNTKMMRVPDEVKNLSRAPTKREMLSAVMSIYDPLGLLSHYTITAKIQLQRLWGQQLDWDSPLPEPERHELEIWLRALSSVAELRLPRCYFNGKRPARQLHLFVDVSTQAYACVAYWRMEEKGRIYVSLIAAKAKVAPTKQLSVPRLELQASLIGARLMNTIKEHHRLEIEKIFLWSDSRTIIYWVRNNAKKYSMYVANRLGEIAELTDPQQWRWVPTKENPADIATRPDVHRQVEKESVWFNGPDFLQRPEDEWPVEQPAKERIEETEEQVCVAQVLAKKYNEPLPDISRFSSYDRLINATGRVLQFIECLKKRERIPFQVKHRKGAEHLWYQRTQHMDFPEEIRSLRRGEPLSKHSRLYPLDPVLDDDGLMRMHGRINAAPVQGLEKRPVILDGRNDFVKMMIQREHQKSLHANNERVINDLRQQFWILRLRPAVRSVASACQHCKIRKAKPQVPAMGDLPLARIEPFKRPFTNTAVDLFGPLQVTIGRRREKRWVALFTCLTTRAVHLEIVHSLSTDSAIMALRRMAARRGWPATMYSDNGTNFRGADVELRRAYEEWLPALQEYGVQKNMEWRFIPPGAPNQGGAWERLVRSVKTALTATLHCQAPREEVLMTLLAEAENVVNARPLTHVSVEARDEEALTPAHFLLGGSTSLPLTGPCQEIDRRTWRAAQALADHFWRRWVREYLPTLAPRQSSANQARPLQPGDCVIIVDPNLPRNMWPRGIVKTTYQGPDGGIRSADIDTKGGVFRRPITKLAVLPVSQAEHDVSAGGDCYRQPTTAVKRDEST